MRGKETVDEALKPAEGASDAEEAVRSEWRRAGLVVSEYAPGRRRTLVVASLADNVAPTSNDQYSPASGSTGHSLVVFVNPWRHCPATHTTVADAFEDD